MKYKVLFLVANNTMLCQMFAGQFQPEYAHLVYPIQEDFVRPESELDTIVTSWTEHDDTMRVLFKKDLSPTAINLVIVPFSAIALTTMLERKRQDHDIDYGIIAIRESVGTQVVGSDLYDILLDSKYLAEKELIEEYLNRSECIFLDKRFDVIKEVYDTHKIHNISRYVDYLV